MPDWTMGGKLSPQVSSPAPNCPVRQVQSGRNVSIRGDPAPQASAELVCGASRAYAKLRRQHVLFPPQRQTAAAKETERGLATGAETTDYRPSGD